MKVLAALILSLSTIHSSFALHNPNKKGQVENTFSIEGFAVKISSFHRKSTTGSEGQSYAIRSNCTASFISENALLTAAHCLPRPEEGLSLHSFLIEQYDQTGTPIQAHKVFAEDAKVHLYPGNYDEDSSKFLTVNDFAVITLSQKIEGFRPAQFLDPSIATIEEVTSKRRNFYLLGAGPTDNKQDPQALRMAVVSRVRREKERLSGEQILAPKTKNGVKTCKGDSGGALVVLQNSRPVIIGVLSKNSTFKRVFSRKKIPCAKKSLFAPLRSEVSDWVRDIVEKEKLYSQISEEIRAPFTY